MEGFMLIPIIVPCTFVLFVIIMVSCLCCRARGALKGRHSSSSSSSSSSKKIVGYNYPNAQYTDPNYQYAYQSSPYAYQGAPVDPNATNPYVQNVQYPNAVPPPPPPSAPQA